MTARARVQPDAGTRRPDIQGLRAVAVIAVVCFHAGLPMTGGFLGVDVFFVISGYVITRMLRREYQASHRIDFARFYLRRFKRLTPALAVVVLVTVLASTVLQSPLGQQRITALTALGAMLLSANIVIATTTGGYFDAPAATNPLLNTWSLSVEEQFYLFFPALLALGGYVAQRRGATRLRPYVLVSLVAASSFGVALLGWSGVHIGRLDSLLGFYSPFTRAWEFAAGALLAMAHAEGRLRPQSGRTASWLGLTGTALLAGSLLFLDESAPTPGWTTWLPVGATALLIAAGSRDGTTTRWLSSRPMVRVGDWSYSIYLWHWPFIALASQTWPGRAGVVQLAAVASLAPAIASYRWVEQPIRRLRGLTRPRWVRLIALTVTPPLVLAVGLQAALRVDWGSDVVRSWRIELAAKHAPSEHGCFTTGPFGPDYVDACTWNRTATGPPIYLVGDSNAWQFAEAAIEAGSRLGRPVTVVTTTSCPFLVGTSFRSVARSNFSSDPPDPREFDHCTYYADTTMDWLRTATPGTVFIAAHDEYWWDPSVGVELTDKRDASASGSDKIDVLRHSLTRTVRDVEDAGHQVVLVQTIPTYRNPTPIWDPRSCTYHDLVGNECHRDLPLSVLERIQGPSRQAISSVAGATGATVLDLRDQFCAAGRCSTALEGRNQYTDATHLTPAASEALAPWFAAAAAAAP